MRKIDSFTYSMLGEAVNTSAFELAMLPLSQLLSKVTHML